MKISSSFSLDQAWDEINALGGCHSSNSFDDGVIKTVDRALGIIESLGGMDPKLRQVSSEARHD